MAMFESCPEKTAKNYGALIEICVRDANLPATERVMANAILAGAADVPRFNMLAKARLQSGHLKKVRRGVKEMRSADVRPNSVTLTSFLQWLRSATVQPTLGP